MRTHLAALVLAAPIACTSVQSDALDPAHDAALDASTAVPEIEPIPQLKPFAPLVGIHWVATFPDGKTTDTQRFLWAFEGKFLRNTHEVRDGDGKVVYSGETMYAWDAREEKLVWWYWNATGGFLTGTIRDEGGGRFTVEGENHGPSGQLAEVKSEMLIADGEWSSKSLSKKDGDWQERFTLRFLMKGRLKVYR